MPTSDHQRQFARSSRKTAHHSTDWRCTRCDKLLGVSRDGRMHLRFARGHEYFVSFPVTARRNGTSLGNIVSADIQYANNLDRIETIRSDGRIDGADPSIAALTGKMDVRFADQVLMTQAMNGTPSELEFAYSLGSGESLTFRRWKQ